MPLGLCTSRSIFIGIVALLKGHSYIHGGGWRDPKTTKSTGYTLIRQVISNSSINAATIDYRLSSHPSYPDEDNHAVHPDHLDDVLSALLYLKASHGLSEKRYILAGHSAGAALLFQVLAKLADYSFFPAAVIGASGVYDFIDVIEEYPGYLGLITGPFGEDKEAWKDVSPSSIGRELAGYAGYAGKIVLLHSDDDEVLSWRQTQGFKDVVNALPGREENKALIVTAKGKHDEVPEGKEIADTVKLLLADLIH